MFVGNYVLYVYHASDSQILAHPELNPLHYSKETAFRPVISDGKPVTRVKDDICHNIFGDMPGLNMIGLYFFLQLMHL